jgi:site-specific recombinase XerD
MALPYLEDFLLYLHTNNYSNETIYNYELDLKSFDFFLQNEFDDIDFFKTNKRTIEQFKSYLVSRDRKTANNQKSTKRLSGASINRCLSSLRGYIRYLIEMDHKTPILPEHIKLVKMEKKHPRVAELELLIKLIETPSHYEKNKQVALRNRAMLEVLFSTGMRISELLNLKKNQIDQSGKIFIMGKGKKERFVYLTERAYEHLRNYLATRNDSLPYLFIPYSGKNNPKKDKKISPNYLQEKIKRYREYLGINVPTSAHSLRHGFATYLAEQGANPAAIQILLGHESLNTTTRYVHASDRYAEKVHRQYHPLKK